MGQSAVGLVVFKQKLKSQSNGVKEGEREAILGQVPAIDTARPTVTWTAEYIFRFRL